MMAPGYWSHHRGFIDRLILESAAQYNLSNPRLSELYNRDNLTLIISSERTRAALRVYSRSAGEEIQFEHSALRQLREEGFPTAGVIESVDGHSYVTLLGYPCALFEYLPGGNPVRPSQHILRECAYLVAQIHRGVNVTRLSGSSLRRSDGKVIATLLQQEEFFRQRAGHLLREILLELLNLWSQYLEITPRVLVHHDLNPSNFLLSRGSLSVIDFDECHLAPPIVDLASMVHYFSRTFPWVVDAKASLIIREFCRADVVADDDEFLDALPLALLVFQAADAAAYLYRTYPMAVRLEQSRSVRKLFLLWSNRKRIEQATWEAWGKVNR
jgi:Ser/Thr protein kinase RdoA (MazF antagonist)